MKGRRMSTRLTIALTAVAVVALAAVGVVAGRAVHGGGTGSVVAVQAAGTTTPTAVSSATLSTPSSSPSTVVSTTAPATLQPQVTSSPTTSSSPSMAVSTTGGGLSLPDPKFGPIDHGVANQSFFGYTFPIPPTWDGTMGDTGVRAFADMTTCTDSESNCPHIYFINLTDATQASIYGADPPTAWFKPATCADGTQPHPVQGPASGQIDGNAVLYYVQDCAYDPYAVNANALWYFPDHQLMVVSSEGANGSQDLGVIQAILKRANW